MTRVLAFPSRGEAPSTGPTDEALLSACAAGDREALAALFDRHHRDTHRFLSRLTGVDAQDVEDCLQATFLEVFRSARRFEGRASVRTWIFATAGNVARHHVRAAVRRRRLLTASTEALPVAAVPGTLEGDGIAAQRLADALASLPHPLRVAFVMCHVEGVPGTEAARALGLREGTLYRHLFEARAHLRRALEAEP